MKKNFTNFIGSEEGLGSLEGSLTDRNLNLASGKSRNDLWLEYPITLANTRIYWPEAKTFPEDLASVRAGSRNPRSAMLLWLGISLSALPSAALATF